MSLFVGIVAGLGCGRWLLVCTAFGALWAAAHFLGRGWRTLAGAAAALTCGLGLGYQGETERQKRLDDLALWAPGQSACVEGRALAGARPDATRVEGWLRPQNSPRKGAEAPVVPVLRGRLRLSLRPPGTPPRAGDLVHACGVWQPPFGHFNFGAPDPWKAVALEGAVGRLRTERLVFKARGVWWTPRRLADDLRRRLSVALDVLPAERAAFLRATVLGERTAVSEDIEWGFKAAGATHALSVSGLHLAAVAALLFVGLRWLIAGAPGLAARVPPRIVAAWLSLPAVIFYTLLTGEAVATWRSALMAGVLFAGAALRRAPSLAASIGFAALAIGLESVFWVQDVSFQLSIGSVVALALFATGLGPPATPSSRSFSRSIARWLWRGFAATAAAGLITGPLVAHWFAEVTPAAFLGNIVLTPLVELFVVPAGLGGSVLSAVVPRFGWWLLWPADQAVRLTLALARGFGAWAPVWFVRPPDRFETLCLTSSFALLLWAWARLPRGRARTHALAGALLGLGIGTLAFSVRGWRATHSQVVQVTFLDVGQGDAAVVEGPGGFVAVVDAGGLGDGFDTGARIVGPFLARRGWRHIDLLALSHPHPDHAEGMPHLLERFDVKQLWMAPAAAGPSAEGPIMRRLRALARGRNTAMPVPAPFSVEGLLVEPLGPWQGDRLEAPEGLSVNDASLSLRLSYGGRSLLFAGDLEGAGELELAALPARGRSPRADILKVPHHGSRTSSSPALLDAVDPDLAVISAGRGNRFGFPHEEVLARYQARHVPVFQTDLMGAVQLRWGPAQALAFQCVRSCLTAEARARDAGHDGTQVE